MYRENILELDFVILVSPALQDASRGRHAGSIQHLSDSGVADSPE